MNTQKLNAHLLLRDYQLTTTDKNTEKRKRQLENQIAFENVKTAMLIEKRKAVVDTELKLESARHKLELSNKCIEIETKK